MLFDIISPCQPLQSSTSDAKDMASCMSTYAAVGCTIARVQGRMDAPAYVPYCCLPRLQSVAAFTTASPLGKMLVIRQQDQIQVDYEGLDCGFVHRALCTWSTFGSLDHNLTHHGLHKKKALTTMHHLVRICACCYACWGRFQRAAWAGL